MLVTIFQRGAVDGLNMIVPFGERDYYAARPSIAIARPGSAADAALDLDGFFGLHPRLAPLKPLYDARQLAIVHACGSPDGTRSHFDAQDYMETATPGVKSTQDGWLNRYLHAREHETATPFRAVALAPQLPRALQGLAPALAIGQIGQFGIRAGRRPTWCSRRSRPNMPRPPISVLNGPARGLRRDEDAQGRGPVALRAGERRPVPASAVRRGAAADRAADQGRRRPRGRLRRVRQLGSPRQRRRRAVGQLANRLDDFARGIAALVRDLGDRMADVVILTMSEFGRAVAENGNRGTDHGHGNAMMVIGGGVRGGKVYGKWPGLAREQRYEGRDLAVTTDFRDVFAEVVRGHLGADRHAARVFPGFTWAGVRVVCFGVRLSFEANIINRDRARLLSPAPSARCNSVCEARADSLTSDTPSVLVDKTRLAQHRSDAGGRRRARHPPPAARQDPQESGSRARQIARGAVGICCAKLGEAEVFADAGIDDIRLPYPLNPVNAARVLALLDRTRSRSSSITSTSRAAGRGDARRRPRGRRAGQGRRRLSSLRHRSGRAGAAPFVARVAALPGLRCAVC